MSDEKIELETTIYYVSCFPNSSRNESETMVVKVIKIPCVMKKSTYSTVLKNKQIKFTRLMKLDSFTTSLAPSAMTYCLENDIEKACQLVKAGLEARVKELVERYTICLENVSKQMLIVHEDK